METFIERAKFTCALLGGAIVTISALPKAVLIVHASGGCATLLSGTYKRLLNRLGIKVNTFFGDGETRIFTTAEF